MAALNVTTQTAVETVQTQFIELNQEFKEYHPTNDLQMQALLRNQNLILQVLNSLPNRLATTIVGIGNGGESPLPPPPPPLHQPAAMNVPPQVLQGQQPTVDPPLEEEEKDDDGAPGVPDEEEAPAPQEPAAVAAVAAVPPRRAGATRQGHRSEALRQALAENALEVINGQPVQPACDPRRPVGYRLCLNEWKANDYDYFRHLDDAVKKRWDFKARFQSRVSVIEEIERLQRAEDEQRDPTLGSCTLEEAADLLDSMLGLSPLCFTKHLAQRRRENPAVDRRNRVPRVQAANPPPGAPRNFFEAGAQARVGQNRTRRRRRAPRTQQQTPAAVAARPARFGDGYEAPAQRTNWAARRQGLDELDDETEDDELTLAELAAQERERRRTQGLLLYRTRGFVDTRNHDGVDRFARDLQALRYLGA